MLLTPLYHWSPAARHASIREHGLQTGHPATVASAVQGHLCMGVDPAAAWAVSGAMAWVSEIEAWDLWLVHIGDRDEVHVREDFGPRIREIMVRATIPPERIWWVGRRPEGGNPTGPYIDQPLTAG